MTSPAIPAWDKIPAGAGTGPVHFALCLDGVVQQVMATNVQTASLLLANPTIIRCKEDAEVGMTVEQVTY